MPKSIQSKSSADRKRSRLPNPQHEPSPRRSEPAGRPIGIIQPDDAPGLRVVHAIEARRIAEAQHHIADMKADTMDARAWHALLLGLITIEQGELSRAEPSFLEAAALALAVGMGDRNGQTPLVSRPEPDMLRLAARAFVHLGWVYRRSERCEDASQVHLAAHRIRTDHGSWEEVWESATALGLDADVTGTFEEGQRWHRMAIEAARNATEAPLEKEALAWTNLETSYEAAEQFDRAVEAARTARHCWYRHDSTAVTAARADAKLGGALLKLSASRLGGDADTDAQGVSESGQSGSPTAWLAEAVQLLAVAHDSLLAFGPAYRAEADACREQGELASHLAESNGR